jgi:hypothetical protein
VTTRVLTVHARGGVLTSDRPDTAARGAGIVLLPELYLPRSRDASHCMKASVALRNAPLRRSVRRLLLAADG